MRSSNKVKGFAAGVVAAVCYGTNPLGTLELYGDGFNSSSVLIYRYLLAVLMFAVVMLFRKESFKVKWGHLIRLGVFALISYALCQFPLYGGRYCQHHPLRLSYYDGHPDDGLLPREGNVVYLACHSSGGIGSRIALSGRWKR